MQYDTDTINRLRTLVKDCPTWLEAREKIVKEMGVHPDNVTKMNKRHGFWSAAGKTPQPSTKTTDGSLEVDIETERIQTMDEVIAACKIDTDRWEAKGFNIRRGKTGFGWSARFACKPPSQSPALLVDSFKAFVKEMESCAPKTFKLPSISAHNERMLEIAVMDAHFARLCWSKETRGEDYDLKIAIRDYKNAVYDLAAQAKLNGVTRILLPLGNDQFNSDNMIGTTSHGTPQAPNEDGRWQKAFTLGCETMVEVARNLAQDFFVDILIVSGNHDYEKCYYMGEFVRAYFHNHPRITVDNSPAQRKYYTFGNTLILFTHGNEEKHGDLPLIMASEMKESWAKSTCREIHVGHFHQHRSIEKSGVVLRVISSLAPQDSWSTSKGYVGNRRAAEAFLFDSKKGLIAQYYHSPNSQMSDR